ncbi:MAG: MBOAT family protein [Oscillospiraceae bacterium]|nr:MBOAT family protein [Oscillospiraceae bacterium]
MLFTSFNFLLFLGALLVVYSLTSKKYRWFVLLVGSMVFYSFAGPFFLLYICSTIVITYICTSIIKRLRIKRDAEIALAVEKVEKRAIREKSKKVAKAWTAVCLVLILGILAVVKYTDFVISNINNTMGLLGYARQFGLLGLALPMGISFYTFQTVGYVVDVYREKAEIQANPLRLALFVSFFPQVVQGPLSRFGELSKTLYSGNPITRVNMARGANRILWGFFKKLVVADRLWPALVVLTSYPEEYQGIYYLLSIALYAIILFCDFTGGIDITIGVAELFGIRLPENFNRPFYSKSIQEYWQRWHMTMYHWFRDYVFYTMAASKRMLKFSKSAKRFLGDEIAKRLPVHITLIWVWFLTGLWHGATWNFIIWGLANGIVIMVSLELAPLYARYNKRFSSLTSKRVYQAFMIFRTFWLMNMIRSFDIYETVGITFNLMLSVITNFSLQQFLQYGVSTLTLPFIDYIAAGVGLMVVFWVSWLGRGEIDYRDKLDTFKWPVRYAVVGLILFMTLVLGAYGHGFDARQFIYNMF